MDVVPPSPYERLSYLRNDINLRLNTFQNWPNNIPVEVNDLVNDGFYYTGLEDKVQCTHCGGILSGWCPGDVVFMEHNRHFPQCPLVVSRRQRNIYTQQCLPTQPVSAAPPQAHGFNFSHQAETGETFELRYQRANNWADNPGGNRPKYLEYAKEASRLQTFKAWPSQISQRPEVLVKSGFFYMGQGDKVKCFFCGGILWEWETDDDVWEEHAKWFPQCPWLKLTKGLTYIEEVQKKLKEQQEKEAQDQQMKDEQMQVNQNQDQSTEESERTMVAPSITAPTEEAESSLCVSSVTKLMEQSSLSDDKAEIVYGSEDTHVKSLDTEPEESENNVAVSSSEAKLSRPAVPASISSSSASVEKNDDIPQDIESILKENRDMKEEKICKICLDKPVSVVFVPCGHMVCCPECALLVQDCPMCRKPIDDRVKAYW